MILPRHPARAALRSYLAFPHTERAIYVKETNNDESSNGMSAGVCSQVRLTRVIAVHTSLPNAGLSSV